VEVALIRWRSQVLLLGVEFGEVGHGDGAAVEGDISYGCCRLGLVRERLGEEYMVDRWGTYGPAVAEDLFGVAVDRCELGSRGDCCELGGSFLHCSLAFPSRLIEPNHPGDDDRSTYIPGRSCVAAMPVAGLIASRDKDDDFLGPILLRGARARR
jgi:hypothetical protein